jgi:hypothetical protein
MENRIASLTIDATDAELLAQFWADVLGWQMVNTAATACRSASRGPVRERLPARAGRAEAGQEPAAPGRREA